jgi:hypothetical protein
MTITAADRLREAAYRLNVEKYEATVAGDDKRATRSAEAADAAIHLANLVDADTHGLTGVQLEVLLRAAEMCGWLGAGATEGNNLVRLGWLRAVDYRYELVRPAR